ncbi:MAG: GNAT family N-acetyltransferase [Defluviitaleaceae bacterium]|nr:GNAT family N-acetyltransferase [Defluviitaleaceae bacterium]
MDITIRQAEVCDIPHLLEMNEKFNGAGATAASMKESLENSMGEIVLVAITNDVVVGFICGQLYKSICYADGFLAELTELYVREEYRRKGVAAKLVSALEVKFLENNAHEIIVKTGDDNEEAHGLYLRCGYEDYEETVFSKEI